MDQPHLERFTPSTKSNPHLSFRKCPTPTYRVVLEKPSTPVWNPCFVHAGCMSGDIVACAKKIFYVKHLDFLAPTSKSCETILSQLSVAESH